MPPTPIDLPVLISALPNIQKVANAEQMKPEMARDLFSPYIMRQQQRENREGVPTVDRGRGPSQVRGEDNQDAPRQQQRQRKEKKSEEEPDSPASNASPWTGNILNIKI